MWYIKLSLYLLVIFNNLFMSVKTNLKKGFTLLEILLVVGIISILAGIVILAINPTKQLGDTRNAQRRSDVLTIMNAVYQYSIDNNGNLPPGISSATESCAYATARDICKVTGSTCSTLGGVDLDLYLASTSALYLTKMPIDPMATSSTGGTGYTIYKSSTSGRVTVCAPSAEQGASIFVTR